MKQLLTIALAGCMLSAANVSANVDSPRLASKAELCAERVNALSKAKVKKTPTKLTRAGYDDVVWEAEGRTENYIKTYSGCYVYMEMEQVVDQKVDAQIVWGDDNSVYFLNPISMLPTETYAKGTADGNKITMKLPQSIYYEEYEYDDELVKSTVYLSLLKYEEVDGYAFYSMVEGENEITFSIADDGSITMDSLEEGYAIGPMAYDGYDMMWYGFAENSISFAPQTEAPFNPADLENTSYSFFTYGIGYENMGQPDFGYKVNVAFDGDDVYFSGLSIDEPKWWFKGHREGDKVIVENNQTLGTLMGTYTVALMFGTPDPDAVGGYSLLPDDSQFIFNYDEDAKIFTTDTPEVVLFINASPDEIFALSYVENPTFIYQPNAAGTPRDPWNLIFDNTKFDKTGFNVFDFNLPIISTDGVLLDRNNMYYNLYIDGELIELDATDYYLDENMVNVPYNYDKDLIVCSRISTYHEMGIKMDGFDKIGVKLFNVCDGVTYESNLVELDVVPGEITSGVNGIAPSANIVSESFYDLSGRKVAEPASGIFVKRTIHEDGTVSVSKVVRK